MKPKAKSDLLIQMGASPRQKDKDEEEEDEEEREMSRRGVNAMVSGSIYKYIRGTGI